MKFHYPNPRRDDAVVDDYHGMKVCDPYRWLEDPDSEETKAIVEAHNKITLPFLQNCRNRERLNARLTEIWDYPKYSCPFRKGLRYFYYLNTGLQNQSVLYVQDSLTAESEVFLDPNKLSEDGTIALRGTSFSEDGTLFAHGLSECGSDWVKIKFMDVETKMLLPDILEFVKFSCMAWTHDHKGLFYNRFPKPEKQGDGTETDSNLNQKLYYHKLGTPQEEDVLCMEIPDEPTWHIGAEVSDCGRYVIVDVNRGCEPVNKLYYADLKAAAYKIEDRLAVVKLVDNFDAHYEYITNEGTVFTFKTNLNSPNHKLININISKPEMEHWKDLIPHHETDVLEWAACVNSNVLVTCYIHDVKNLLYLHELSTGNLYQKLPLDIGSITGFSGRKIHTEMFYYFTSFLAPGVIYHFDFKGSCQPEVFREICPKGFDAMKYETEQVFYFSKDGIRVPMFLVHHKNLALDGNNPVLLYGYGGFHHAMMPTFSISRLVFMQHFGGVYAVANIRGGSEYGEGWYKEGSLGQKQNTFNDFQGAAEFLIQKNYTSAKRLAIMGGSNGGLLVCACANQRPDLFGLVISQVGVLDMLRYHKFTIGHAWVTDYGSSEDKEQFEWLIKYSPLHNIKEPKDESIQYPAMLFLTADHDDRVVPLHSLKYVSQLHYCLRDSKKQTNPLLMRIDTKSGHGAGKPTTKVIEELADIYAFMAEVFEIPWKE